MSLFLDGTLRNTWGGSEKSSNNSARQVSYLGHAISAKGVRSYPHKIRAVEQWPIPAEVSDVRSFLGLDLYYHRFIVDFVEITVPLHQVAGVVSPVPLQD